MQNRELEGHSLWAWTAAGFFGPAAWFLGSVPWTWTLGLGAGMMVLWYLSTRHTGNLPKWAALLELAFLVPVIGMAASKAAACWPSARDTAAFPLVLLVLAGCAAASGPRAGARCGAVLFWFAAAMALVLTGFGLPEVRWEYLAPGTGTISGEGAFALTLPACAMLLPRKKGKGPWQWAVLLLAGAVSVSVLSAGVLSASVAAGTEGAYFQMARGISILGVAERFEAVVAAALTLGWFCLLSLLLSGAEHMGHILHPGWGRGTLWTVAVLAGLLLFFPIPFGGWLFAGLALCLWYLLPMCAAP